MNLGKHLETKDDRKIAKDFIKEVKKVDSRAIFYDPEFNCNYFMIGLTDYCKNKYVRNLIDEKLMDLNAWIFVTHIREPGMYKRKKVLKLCWEPATDKKYENMPERHRSVSRGGFNRKLYKEILKVPTLSIELFINEIEEHTIKYLKSRGIKVQKFSNGTIYFSKPKKGSWFVN